jgi:hypothetical protein
MVVFTAEKAKDIKLILSAILIDHHLHQRLCWNQPSSSMAWIWTCNRTRLPHSFSEPAVPALELGLRDHGDLHPRDAYRPRLPEGH